MASSCIVVLSVTDEGPRGISHAVSFGVILGVFVYLFVFETSDIVGES